MTYLKRILPLVIAVILSLSCVCAETEKTEGFSVTYRDCLSAESVAVYDAFLKNAHLMKDGKSNVKIYFENGVPEKDINRVMQSAASAFSLDHPELFWISHNRLSFVYTVTDGAVYSITAEKKEDEENYYALPYTSKDEIEEDERLVRSKMDDILKRAEECRSVFEKILLFHDTLCKMNVYNSYVNKGENEKADARAWEATSAFLSDNDPEKGPVCEGYSKAFKMLCDAVGIPCVLIPGDGIGHDGKVSPHMWCAVYVYDKWYGVDVTWDDPAANNELYAVRYTYLLCGSSTEDFEKKHIPDVEKFFSVYFPTPDISETPYKHDDSIEYTFVEVSDVTAVYEDTAAVTVTVLNGGNALKHESVKLYRNSAHEDNYIGEYKLEKGLCRAEFETLGMSSLNDVRIVAMYGGNVSAGNMNIKPKEADIDVSQIRVEYSNGVPYHTGKLTASDGISLHYTQRSELSEDGKKLTVYFSDIAPFDDDYITADSISTEFDINITDHENAEDGGKNYVYLGVCAIGVVLCMIVSHSKRK